eukprot:3762996-Alexandrium_andersonii.AAC.1
MQHRMRRSKLDLRGPMNGLTCPPCKASSGAFSVIAHAESDGNDGTCRRARRRRLSGVSGGARSPPGKTQ